MLKELLSALESRKQGREGEFQKVVKRIAAGDTVTPASVEKVLAESSKTADDLRAAVELATQRREWHAQRKAAATFEKERTSIEKQIAAEDRKLEQADEAHELAIAPLRARLHEIRAAVSAAQEAQRKLHETCQDDRLRDEQRDIDARRTALHARAHALREQAGLDRRADAEDAEIERLEAGLIPGRTTAFVDERRAQATRHRELAKEARSELAQVEKELARLEREEAAVYERMLEP